MIKSSHRSIRVNIPKPGDPLPFTLCEWTHEGQRFRIAYTEFGDNDCQRLESDGENDYWESIQCNAERFLLEAVRLPYGIESEMRVA